VRAPAAVSEADYLIMESTYGDRLHDPADPRDKLADVVTRTVARGGVVVVPSFAVGRAQALLYLVHLLRNEERIPTALPIYLNSPMAADVTALYHRFRSEHRLTPEQCDAMCKVATIVNGVEESKALNQGRGRAHHRGERHGDRRHAVPFACVCAGRANTILLTGFRAGGTR
jgi:metallo-beta-lactamase family protein